MLLLPYERTCLMGVWILAFGGFLVSLVFLSLTKHIVNASEKTNADLKTLTARVESLERGVKHG